MILEDKALLEGLWHAWDHRNGTRRTGRAGRVSGLEEIVEYGPEGHRSGCLCHRVRGGRGLGGMAGSGL